MWIQVRSMDGKKTVRLDGLSKLSKIEEIREKLVDTFHAPPERQKLFHRGKQLLDGYTLFDYDVGLNELIQILVRSAPPVDTNSGVEKDGSTKADSLADKDVEKSDNEPIEEETASDKENQKPEVASSSHVEDNSQLEGSLYKVGDIIDVRDETMGAWFEADLVKVTRGTRKQESKSALGDVVDQNQDLDTVVTNNVVNGDADMKDDIQNETSEKMESSAISKEYTEAMSDWLKEDDGFLYHVKFESSEGSTPEIALTRDVRPRARNKVKLASINPGDTVMVNYNCDEPESSERGYWYDAVVTSKRCTRTIKELVCTVFVGTELVPLKDCKINFWWDVFKIENPGTQLNSLDAAMENVDNPQKRTIKPHCERCRDNPKVKCKQCSCRVCGGKDEAEKQIMCDDCDAAYHIWCLTPPLKELPDDDYWYCPACKVDTNEVVGAGQKLKESKKKAKMVSAASGTKRDWGRGMACAGRTKKCEIVNNLHFGPIPGVEVGSSWFYRLQASEAGVHRPHVAGIHGQGERGAFSIVLAAGYEDDKDDGEEFTYTGSGGRDLSGNKRTAEQSCDQELTRMNKALARNCNAPLNSKTGGESQNWKAGKPVRVIRSAKGRKHSKYAPEVGNRYDGIYKVVKYWQEAGKSGFKVWRYMLRRDDLNPAPWTEEGEQRIRDLGLTMVYPEGYVEKEKEKAKTETAKKGKRKRKISSSSEEDASPPSKKQAPAEIKYTVDSEVTEEIKKDNANEKLWTEALEQTKNGMQVFLAKVQELFECICCQELVFKPVTTDCSHNLCRECLKRAFKAEVYSCPACRKELGKSYVLKVNNPLTTALNKLFPGYENGR